MAPVVWDAELADIYDSVYSYEAQPSVLDPMVDVLVEIAQGGRSLEFAVGTGRVALALSARGISVCGIELSPDMASKLRAKDGSRAVPVTIGDMTCTRIAGTFDLVYLVANAIMNLTTQDEQLAVFANAADHLAQGGRFVVEVVVPQLRRFPPGITSRVFTNTADHVGIETLDDPVSQIASSHHWMTVGDRVFRHSAPYRYVWPAELDLMGRLTGFDVTARWAGWDRSAFMGGSRSQVVVFTKTK